MINLLESIKLIEHKYTTGEEPVLVQCSDLTTRICKYSRLSGSAYKLACELIGNFMANAWNIGAPDFCFVNVLRQHVPNDLSPHFFSRPCIGTALLEGVVDVTPSSYQVVTANSSTLLQLMKIALFDFWMANEDRNSNNANLMYDINNDIIIPIDFGCILNTATFDYKLMQLTSTDTILYSDIFQHIASNVSKDTIFTYMSELKDYYMNSLQKSKNRINVILEAFPMQWNIPSDTIQDKLQELFSQSWTEEVWNNFVEQLKDNLPNE